MIKEINKILRHIQNLCSLFFLYEILELEVTKMKLATNRKTEL